MGLLGRLFGPKGERVEYGKLEPGMVFRVRGGDHVKIVKVEDAGVHVVDVGTTDSIEMDGVTIAMGGMHMPWSRPTWESSRARLVRTDQVQPAELEGYEMWHSDGGGWF